MTLTSIHWVDADGNNSFNAGDTLTLDGHRSGRRNCVQLHNEPGVLTRTVAMSFNGGGYNGYVLDAALAESPDPSLVPEPTMMAMVLGGMLMAQRRRRI